MVQVEKKVLYGMLIIFVVVIISITTAWIIKSSSNCVWIGTKCWTKRCEVWYLGNDYITRDQLYSLYTLQKVGYDFPNNSSISMFDLRNDAFYLEIFYPYINETQRVTGYANNCSAWSLMDVVQ